MRFIVDKMPENPEECRLSHQTNCTSGNYVCELRGSIIVCNPQKCEFLKPLTEPPKEEIDDHM